MQRPILRGAAANSGLIFHVFAQDSTSTTGAGKASIAFGSWTCYYIRSGEAISGAITPQDITTIGTYAAPTANTNIRIKAVDNTNMIGVYELQLHLDWVNTTNACYLTATGVAVLPVQIPLVAVGPQVAKPTNFNLIVIDSDGRLDISKFAGQTITAAAGVTMPATVASTTNITAGTITTVSGNVNGNVTGSVGSVVGAAGSVTGAVGSVTGNVGGNVTGSVGSVAGNVTGSVGSVVADVGITQGAADKVFGASGAAMAELGAVPSATPSPRNALMLMFMALRNKLTVSATAKTLTNDAGSAIASKVLSDSGTVYTEDEMS